VGTAGLLAAGPAAWAQLELVVPNFTNNSVTVYARTADGDVAPLRTLVGAATGLANPNAVAVDRAHDEVIVANGGGPSITVYGRTASGNVAPLRTLSGGATVLLGPAGMALDPVNEEIFVTNFAGNVVVHSRTASGNTPPLRVLSGLSFALGVLVDPARDELFVANAGNSSVTVYARTATGNAPPLRTISGAATGLSSPRGLALDPVTDQLLVTNANNSVTAYPRTANGNVAPVRTLVGGATALSDPFGLAVDPFNHELAVTNQGSSALTVYAREATGNAAPLRTLSGGTTGLGMPHFLAAPDLSPLVSTGTGAGGGPHVRLFRFDTTEITVSPVGGGFFAYDPGFTGGVQATLVRVQGSLFLVTGVGAGGGPHVKLFKVTNLATGAVVQLGPGFMAYDPTFTGGTRVAATTDPDGNLLIVTGVGASGGPHVKFFKVTNLATGAVVQLGPGFMAYNPLFNGGVNVGAQ
jgi:DNA-binding beta-propeller fold protein YncE